MARSDWLTHGGELKGEDEKKVYRKVKRGKEENAEREGKDEKGNRGKRKRKV